MQSGGGWNCQCDVFSDASKILRYLACEYGCGSGRTRLPLGLPPESESFHSHTHSRSLVQDATTLDAGLTQDVEMALPPERISVKRRRAEDPVEALCGFPDWYRNDGTHVLRLLTYEFDLQTYSRNVSDQVQFGDSRAPVIASWIHH